MFGEKTENDNIVNESQKNIEFSTQRFNEVSKDFDRFTERLIEENEIDPENLGPTWAGPREVSLTEVKDRYILALYANLETRDQLLTNKEPRILEIGSYMTGLIPAMYLSSKGFKPEVIDRFPIKENFPKLTQIAEKKYHVKIHRYDIKELPESFKGVYDMVYIQSFPALGFDYEDLVAESVYSILKKNGMFLMNDGGGDDMFSIFSPHFTEQMGLNWRYLGESLNIGEYKWSRIAVLRKNSELEKIIFYLKSDFESFAWPIAYYNFVVKDYSEKDNIDIEKFTRGHIFSLIMDDYKNELPVMQEEGFDFYKVRKAHIFLSYMLNRISRSFDYLPVDIQQIIQEYKLRLKDLNVFTLRTLQKYLLFRSSWFSEFKKPIQNIVTSKEKHQEEIAYYQKIYKQTEDEWIEYIERMKREGKRL
jgi:hypothetical protein